MIDRIKTAEEMIAEANALLDQQQTVSQTEETEVEKLVSEIIAKDEVIKSISAENDSYRSIIDNYKTEAQQQRDNDALSINDRYKGIDADLLSDSVRQILADDAFSALLANAKNFTKNQKQQLFAEMI